MDPCPTSVCPKFFIEPAQKEGGLWYRVMHVLYCNACAKIKG